MADEGAANFTREKWDEMIQLLDKDGDGTVDKEEYFLAYKKMFPNLTDEECDAQWTKIDADGDGTLTVLELAQYYGFNLDGETTAEMSDEQILEALQMQAALVELNAAKEAELKKIRDEKKAKEEEEKLRLGVNTLKARDPTIKMVNMENAKDQSEEDKEIVRFLEACNLGDLESQKPDKDTVLKYIEEKKVKVRIECEKAEMPLHKIARVKVDNNNKGQYAKVFDAIIQKSREEAKAAGLKSISSDINHQDKAGKTPLYLAIEHNNLTLMKLLYTLGAESPDSLLVNNQGWTIMHSAVNTDNLETLKKLMDFFTPQRIKLLLQTPDKTGREPLHIAAYKCSEEMVSYLMDVGAANVRVDSNGNDPAKLADRAGRRKSKEIIERRSSKEGEA